MMKRQSRSRFFEFGKLWLMSWAKLNNNCGGVLKENIWWIHVCLHEK